MKSAVVVLVLMAGMCAGLDESFSGTRFPPRRWIQACTDVGTARWQRSDGLCRTAPGCAFCAAEKRGLRNTDWLITAQCSVAVGDSFGFWLRARDAAFRESVEVWVSDSSPFVPDFRLFATLATSSTSYERYAFDVSSLAGREVFFAIVYVSAGGKGVLVDDVFGPRLGYGDLVVYFPADQPRHIRTDCSFIPRVGISNFGEQAVMFTIFYFIHNKYGVRMYSEFKDTMVNGGEDATLSFIPFNVGNDTGRWMIACSLSAVHPWNTSRRMWLYIEGFQPYGGPDSAGYTWMDSGDTLGPEYQWFEVSTSGTRVGGGDDELYEVPLPWPIRFYGQSCSTACVSTNGWLALGPPAPAGPADSNTAIPFPAEPNRLIAAYWDDLASAGSESGIWYQAIDDSTVVLEWHDFGYYGFEACTLNFEALLHRSGIVELEYQRVSVGDTLYDQGLSATVGAENGTGTIGLEYLHDGSPPGNLLCLGRAIRFLPREYGIEETMNDECRVMSGGPTILSGSSVHSLASSVFFDAMGRRVPNPKSGVFFVVSEPQAASRQPSAVTVRKVVIPK